jgi:DNA invertase Pin-like site-specific DNA recombinase
MMMMMMMMMREREREREKENKRRKKKEKSKTKKLPCNIRSIWYEDIKTDHLHHILLGPQTTSLT